MLLLIDVLAHLILLSCQPGSFRVAHAVTAGAISGFFLVESILLFSEAGRFSAVEGAVLDAAIDAILLPFLPVVDAVAVSFGWLASRGG